MSHLLFKTSDSLTIKLKKEVLAELLNLAENNFFNYVFEHTDTVFYKENSVSHFGIFTTTEHTKMSYEEAKQVYDKMGFKNIIANLDNKKYFTIFTNYTIMLDFNENLLDEILIYDFKLLLDIAGRTIEAFTEGMFLETRGSV